MAPLLQHHRAIITGASRGIGLSIARLFAQEGASCLLVARSEPALQAAVAELETLKLPVPGKGPGRLKGEREDMGVEGLEWMEQDGASGGEAVAVGQRFGYVVGSVGEERTWREVVGREVSSGWLIDCGRECLELYVYPKGGWGVVFLYPVMCPWGLQWFLYNTQKPEGKREIRKLCVGLLQNLPL